MNHLILSIFLLISLPRPKACPETDKNPELYRVFVEVGQIKTWIPIEDDVEDLEDLEDEELVMDGVETHLIRKRSPRCVLSCLRQKRLHPAQCHSFCRFHFG